MQLTLKLKRFDAECDWGLAIGDWRLGTGDWGLAIWDWRLGTGDLGLAIGD